MATPDQYNNDTESPGQIDQVNQVVQTSRLLALSAELRNRVYMFALTTDNGLIRHDNRSNLDLVVVTHKGRLSRQTFNKLKFVCKQLWEETRMLELMYNTVDFGIYTLYNTPIPFIEHLSPNHRSWLSSIRICEDSQTILFSRNNSLFAPRDVVAAKWQSFITFCELNPRVNVQVILSDWNITRHHRFWGVGCQIAAFSGREDTVQFIATVPSVWSKCSIKATHFRNARHDQNLAARFKDVKNITFIPSISEVGKRYIIETNGKRIFDKLDPARGEKWLELGVSWVTDGIQLG